MSLQPDPHANFRAEVECYTAADPYPTIATLSALTGVPEEKLIRYILVKYAASSSDALLSLDPIVFRQMKEQVARAEAADTDEARLGAYRALKDIVGWLGIPQDSSTTTLYRPTGEKELALIKQSGWRAFPPRLPEQPIFYPVTNIDYAIQIARDWNTRDGGTGYVLRFDVHSEYLSRFEPQTVGSSLHQEYWIPAEDLAEFNSRIHGIIEVVRTFSAESAPDSGGQ